MLTIMAIIKILFRQHPNYHGNLKNPVQTGSHPLTKPSPTISVHESSPTSPPYKFYQQEYFSFPLFLLIRPYCQRGL